MTGSPAVSVGSATRLLVLDLDGTLCLGDAPVLAYARAAAQALGGRAGRQLLDAAERFLAGEPAIVPGASDGYQAIARLGGDAGLGRRELGEAYARSRAALDDWIHEVRAPEGAARLLASLPAAGVRRALVTNAAGGLDRLLAALGLADVLDDVVGGAAKPDRMPERLDALEAELAPSGLDPADRLAGMGDIWRNDLAAIAERDGSTFLIDRHSTGDGSPTARAARPEDLLGALAEWAHGVYVSAV